MAETLKVLGQVQPGSATLTPIYTVPASTSTLVGEIVICNVSNIGESARVSVAIAGAVDATSQYIVRDLAINPNDTVIIPIGATLATTDVVRVRNAGGNLAFTLFGVEIT